MLSTQEARKVLLPLSSLKVKSNPEQISSLNNSCKSVRKRITYWKNEQVHRKKNTSD